MGTIHGMITSGDLINEMPGRDMDVGPETQQEGMEQQPMQPAAQPMEQGMPNEMQ